MSIKKGLVPTNGKYGKCIFFGKKYSVPADLTIMTAMEYAGYTLKEAADVVMDSVEPVQRFIN